MINLMIYSLLAVIDAQNYVIWVHGQFVAFQIGGHKGKPTKRLIKRYIGLYTVIDRSGQVDSL